jgi:hypothetical protein
MKVSWKKSPADGQWIMYEDGVQVAMGITKKDCRREAEAWGRKASRFVREGNKEVRDIFGF